MIEFYTWKTQRISYTKTLELIIDISVKVQNIESAYKTSCIFYTLTIQKENNLKRKLRKQFHL